MRDAGTRVYRTSGREDVHEFLVDAVGIAGARVLYASPHTRTPVYLGIEVSETERIGLLCYPFRCTGREIKNRPLDEHRAQIRYGAEETWNEEHPLGIDVAAVDVTAVLGVHVEEGIFIGLDPLLYDPLPMGISIEFKSHHVESTLQDAWHVWQRPNRAGLVRATARAEAGRETVVGFTPERLIDYIRFEREASSLALDPLLRERAATAAATQVTSKETRHMLEELFHVRSEEMLDIISKRKRLQMAVRGGVAEHHLKGALSQDHAVTDVEEVDSDGPPDVKATLRANRRVVGVECKNGEEHGYADGDGRVEVQKTRSSKGDPASRYYKPEQFDVLAVCLWPQGGGPPRFVYRRSRDLARHPQFPDRLAVMHRINDGWATTLAAALG